MQGGNSSASKAPLQLRSAASQAATDHEIQVCMVSHISMLSLTTCRQNDPMHLASICSIAQVVVLLYPCYESPVYHNCDIFPQELILGILADANFYDVI